MFPSRAGGSAPLDHKFERDPDLDELESPTRNPPRRRLQARLKTLLCILTFLGLLAAVVILFWSRGQNLALPVHADLDIGAEHTPHPTPQSTHTPWVVGEPTEDFRDNLRGDTQYVTSWVAGGWTNDFMTYINMIYLGLLASRVPIIPPFAPSHVDYDAGFPPFGDVFDVPRLAAAINSPLLEWRDVKHENSSKIDPLGCWSIWGLVAEDGKPRGSLIPQRLKLDVAYTNLPKSSEIISGPWVPFWTLARLGFPSSRSQALAEDPFQTAAPHSGTHIPPDERLMCFDFMYYIGAQVGDEWWFEWSPAWRFVGRHARWEPSLERLAVGYIQRALGLDEDGDKVPPYVAVHARRGDFTAACNHAPADECFQPLTSYARRVSEVFATLSAERGISIPTHHVLVTSDETDPAWWHEVEALGWRRADHALERTQERYGKWYLPLIDAVVQSLAVGFVGTDRSTMSLVAQRRVEDWNGGVTQLVPIGMQDPGAH